MLTVYEKDNCQACLFTKRTLSKHGVDYEVKPITEEVLAHAAELGFKSAPSLCRMVTGARRGLGPTPHA